MTEFTPAFVAASVGRALWGEVSSKLRSVQYKMAANRIELRFFLDGGADGDELDSIGCVGAEVAADFPDATVLEEAVVTSPDSEIICPDGWHTAYARNEASMAR
jgi:hypothetical protein